MNTEVTQPTTLKGEFFRKLIHILSSVIPLGYLFLDKTVLLSVLIPVLFLMLLVEIMKYRIDTVYRLYLKYFRVMLRPHEFDKNKLRMSGATWLMTADVLCIIFFPKLIAVTGMLLLSLSDSSSAIAGRLFGKKQFAPNRSYAGTLTFICVGMAIVFLTPKYVYSPAEYLLCSVAVMFTAIVDAINLPTDDNFAIPVVSSLVLYILYIVFFPGIFDV